MNRDIAGGPLGELGVTVAEWATQRARAYMDIHGVLSSHHAAELRIVGVSPTAVEQEWKYKVREQERQYAADLITAARKAIITQQGI